MENYTPVTHIYKELFMPHMKSTKGIGTGPNNGAGLLEYSLGGWCKRKGKELHKVSSCILFF